MPMTFVVNPLHQSPELMCVCASARDACEESENEESKPRQGGEREWESEGERERERERETS
jgi:hypothetical protein